MLYFRNPNDSSIPSMMLKTHPGHPGLPGHPHCPGCPFHPHRPGRPGHLGHPSHPGHPGPLVILVSLVNLVALVLLVTLITLLHPCYTNFTTFPTLLNPFTPPPRERAWPVLPGRSLGRRWATTLRRVPLPAAPAAKSCGPKGLSRLRPPSDLACQAVFEGAPLSKSCPLDLLA